MPGGLKLTKKLASNFSSSEPAAPSPLSSRIPLTPSSKDKLEDSIKIGGKFLHRWNDGYFYYEAKITKIDEKSDPVKYNLHYNKWASSFDTKLTRDEILSTCRIWTKEEAEKAAKEVAAAQKDLSKSGSKSQKSRRTALNVSEDRSVSNETPSAKRMKTPPFDLIIKKEGEIQISPKLEQLCNLECVFPPKFTIDKAFKMYSEKLTTKQKSPCPPHSVEKAIEFLKLMQDDCNDHFPELLTKNEVPEYIKILNEKRAVLDLSALDENDYLDNDDDDDEEKENENKTPVSQIVLPVHESFDIIYFLRFVKHFNEKTEENQLGIQFYRPLFDDFLNFIDGKITTEMYDDEME